MKKSDNTKSLFKELADASVNSKTNPSKEFINSLTKAEKEQIITNATNFDNIKELSKLASHIKENNVKKKNKGGHIKPLSWLYIAASIIIFFGLFLFINKDNNSTNNIETIIVDNNIETGTDKATLTLGSGEEVVLVKGTSFQTQNATSNGEAIIYDNNTSRELVYNHLTIPRGGQFQLTLSDGTQVWLNSDTQLKYPVSFTGGESRQVELLYGEAYFDVSPSTDHDGAKFKVYHKSQEVEVLGTEFNIKAYKDETNIYTTLVEGKVSLSVNNTTDKIVLKPNDQANLNLSSNILQTKAVNVYNETSWRLGVFSFKNKPLIEIMKVLSRWYDMDDVDFENKAREAVMFDGVLNKNQKIEDIMTTIKETGFITNFTITDKKITIQ